MNTIVIVLRGCPVSCLGPYGNEWIATPNFDRLAAEGVVFDRHLSDCPDSAAAGRAWRSGQHQVPPLAPSPRGDEGPGVKGVPPSTDLLTLLNAQSVRTILVRNCREANDSHPEFYAGWDEMFDAPPDPIDRSPADALLRLLPDVLDRLPRDAGWLLWIEIDHLLPPWQVRQEVFDVYIEDLLADAEPEDDDDEGIDSEGNMAEEAYEESELDGELDENDYLEDEPLTVPAAEREPVQPWTDPPTGWFDQDDPASWELLHRTFAAVVTVLDADLGQVFELFRERGLDRTAAWVATADRGQPLGEHGIIGYHRPWLHEELVHVPLIVRLPDAAESGRRVSALTQPADLMPTLLEWAGGGAPAPVSGVSLVSLIQGRAEAVRSAACTGLVQGAAGEWAIRTPQWALLLPAPAHPDDDPREPMLFEKPDDRWEVNDLRPRHLDRSDELEAELRRTVGET